MTPDQLHRFFKKVSYSDTGCWNWDGYLYPNGYAQFSINSRPIAGHRVAFKHFKGSIPKGMMLDHLCRNKRCVNPEHLEIVTCRENNLRGELPWARLYRTGTCKRGHPWVTENIYRSPKGVQACRTCKNSYKNKQTSNAQRNNLPEYAQVG